MDNLHRERSSNVTCLIQKIKTYQFLVFTHDLHVEFEICLF